MKIRIKMAINSEGEWCAYGWQGMNDSDPNDTLYECVPAEGCLMEHWIIADVPIPHATDIAAIADSKGEKP